MRVGSEGNAPCSAQKELAGMGIILQNSCNLLNTLLKNNHQRLSIVRSRGVSDFNKLQNSMERCNRESIKNAMLKHEEIFQKQVHELHRLYHVQKMMMIELRSKEVEKMNSVVAATKNNFQGSTSTSETTHSSLHRLCAIAAVQSSQELSNCLGEPLRVSGESPESCSNEGCNLDLTLSIGSPSDKKRETDWKRITNDSITLLPSNLKECTNSTGGFGAESLKRPHWLVQSLSLNRT